MPDPTLETISATQVSALFGASPYVTERLLWRVFTGKDTLPELDADENERMRWGTLLETPIFMETLRRLNVEGQHNDMQAYVRHETLPIGCTPDGECWHPSRGRAIVQVKNVDWLVWRDKWTEKQAPAHIELQVQHEMLVKDADWGVIACLVGGNELRIYERQPDAEIQADILARVGRFFERVKTGDAPDWEGVPMEVPKTLEIVRPERETVDLSEVESAHDAMQALKHYEPMAKEANKAIRAAKAKLLGLADGADVVLAHGYGCEIKKSQTKPIIITLPDEIKADLLRGNVDTALKWEHVARRGGVRTSYKVFDRETEGPAPWLRPLAEEAFIG